MMRAAAALAALAALSPTPALACAACFGDPGSAQTGGMTAAILALLGVALGAGGGLGYTLWVALRRDGEA